MFEWAKRRPLRLSRRASLMRNRGLLHWSLDCCVRHGLRSVLSRGCRVGWPSARMVILLASSGEVSRGRVLRFIVVFSNERPHFHLEFRTGSRWTWWVRAYGGHEALEAPEKWTRWRTVLKPTPVGTSKSTKVWNDSLLRNSANSHRTFATRWTEFERIQWHNIGGSDCLTKTQVHAKSMRRSIWADACHVHACGGRGWTPLTEAHANGRDNPDRAKVA